ncbi:deoxyribodipyrimidine photolyase [Chryseobacterium sp. Leaf180]|uniref:cryptochrome/photolyase family protein n=1 Tax=Chryseobacterium sp. Leaf180 TaxID=1736289 RepID=UPI0006F63413|nr:cryptochrome/photolyase family protein [Chryseobacterium sp. Leaf180]KQR91828.1 deoxyribodipyrimidine photolyase [Chryseobacterium sp. Leaf180]
MAKKTQDAAQLVFPHQLYQNIHHFKKDVPIYLIEEDLYFMQFKFHKQKIVFHRASMKFYEDFLKEEGFKVHYIETHNDESDIRVLLTKLKKEGCEKIIYADVTDNWLEKRLREGQMETEISESQIFLNTRKDLEKYFEEKDTYHQTDFYKQQRADRDILMDGEKPAGGKWTFDTENRKRYPKSKKAPSIHFPENSTYYDEAVKYTEKNFDKNYGELTSYQLYPCTFKDAEKWLQHFFENRFQEFGVYEDSLVEHEHFLHHSVISPLLNTGLLTPHSVLKKAIAYAEKNDIPMNSTEGFVRQIVGWREFIRGIYIYEGSFQRRQNFWKHKKPLPHSFYTAETGIKPIDSCISKIIKTGYAHHIERLMVFANFMNLSHISPDDRYDWFMTMFIDSYDWVMVPNVYGMSSYSDGGIMSTKPYVSGSNYLKKMSDYASGEWTELWDGLFWNFVHDNQDFFKKNPRLGMMVRTLEKMNDDTREKHLKTAKNYIESKE